MKFQIKRERLLASTMIAGFALAGLAAPAMAQTAPQAEPEQTSQISDVVVTGSRIRQPNLTTTSPVTQVTGEDIDIQGVTRVEDLITQLPQAFASQNSTVSNGASGTATVSLRNLGSSRTLVLINGRRMPYGSPQDAAADLNQIPSQLVDRVEVLTGGASAVYGSDAVAGVVNFIMKKDFEGLEISAQYGLYQHNNDYDGPGNLREVIARRAATNPSQYQLPDDNIQNGFSREINAIMGISSPDGKGNITAYAGYRKNNKVLGREYDYSSCSLGAENSAAREFTCGGSGTSYPGRFTDGRSFAYSLDPNGNFRDYDGSRDAYNFGPLNYFQRPDERYTLGAFGHYQVNDKIEAYTELMFNDYRSVAQIAPSGDFGNTGVINCDNPLLSAAQAAAIGCSAANIAAGDTTRLSIFRRNVEGGGRQSDLSFTSYRGVVGIRGDLNDAWSYDLSGQYSKVRLSQIYRNEFSVARLTRALDVVKDGSGAPVCRSVLDGTDPDCVPYNVFKIGGVTKEALDYLQVPLVMSGWTTQQVVTGSVAGDLGTYGVTSPWASRGAQVVAGVEYRRDALDLVTDVSYQTADGAGQGGPTKGLGGANATWDVFGEFQLPLIEGKTWAESMSLDGAYRHSSYTLGGEVDTWKVGFDYAPISDVRFRASYQAATRAPNVIDLFTAQGFNLFDMDFDPCDAKVGPDNRPANAGPVPASCIGANPWQVTQAVSNAGFLTNGAGQYNYMQGGNRNLTPEESNTLTLGVVLQPSFLHGFNISVDYFDIKIDNLISTIGSTNTLADCYNNNIASACQKIHRNPDGQLWTGSGYVEDLNANIGGLKTSGVDIVSNYAIDLSDWGIENWGRLAFAFNGTWLSKLETDTGTGQADSVYDCAGLYGNTCGVPNPEWRHRARVDWSTPIEGVNIAATWRYFGEAKLDDGNRTRLDSTLDAMNYFDLAATWQARDNLSLRMGVNNVFDADPPLSTSVGTTGNNNTYPQLYDALGRYVFFGVTANF